MFNFYTVIFFLISSFTPLMAKPIIERSVPIESFKKLVEITQLDPEGDLLAQTQQNWYRGNNQECWHLDEKHDLRQAVINWGLAHDLYADWQPSLSHYNKAVILGCHTHPMRHRIQYLVKLWEKGVRFSEIVFLTSKRPIAEGSEDNFGVCQTEEEAARYFWEQAEKPAELKAIPVKFMASEMKNQNGKLIRPSTVDTLKDWQYEKSEPFTALFISSQPFCYYQYEVLHTHLAQDDHIDFELVGPSRDYNAHPRIGSVTLDTLACWYYTKSRNPNRKP